MKNSFLAILTILFLTECSREKNNVSEEKINVSDIYPRDNLGNLIGSTPNDNQWKSLEFTSTELTLFNALDTANLSGTQLPTLNTTCFGYPNPFSNHISIHTSLTQPLNGEIVIKYVIVNNTMNMVQRGSTRIYVTSSIDFMIACNFSNGNYRLYFTYSAEGHKHFFKSWGNIHKV